MFDAQVEARNSDLEVGEHWPGGLAAWNIALYAKRLWVKSPFRARA